MNERWNVFTNDRGVFTSDGRLAMLACLMTAFHLAFYACAQDTITNFMSPVVSYQYSENLCSATLTSGGIQSPLVSFQYLENFSSAVLTNGGITSPIISYQYYEWPGNGILNLQSSPVVSYFYEFGDGNVVILTPPVSQFVQIGGTATFQVTADGQPALGYQWQMGTTPIAGATNPVLNVNNAQPSDGGAYSVTVSNVYGSVTSAAASLAFLVQTNRQPTSTEIGQPTIPSDINSHFEVFTNGHFQTGIAPDPNLMTIVITHGWNDDPTNWVDMATALYHDVVGASANIVAWDWHVEASNGSFYAAANQTLGQGLALGQALFVNLGSNYSNPIHFIGHSLGTLVNANAADYLHGDIANSSIVKGQDAFLPQDTQMTLLDEAALPDDAISCVAQIAYYVEEGSADLLQTPAPTPPYFGSAMPKQAAWIDNYVTAIGVLHAKAANVILTQLPGGAQEFYTAPDFNTFWSAATAFHAYSHSWYDLSIASGDAASLMGNRWSFERDGFGNAPQLGSVFLQTLTGPQLDLQAIDPLAGLAYVTLNLSGEGEEFINLGVSKIGGLFLQASGQVIANVSDTVIQDGYSLASTAASDTQAIFVNLQTSITSLSIPNGRFRPLDAGSGNSSSSNSPAYVWMPLAVPSNALFMSFDFLLNGNGQNDSFEAAVGGTNVLALETTLIQTNVLMNSGLINVSSWSGQTVEVFLGIVGGTSTNASITASGFRFYSVAQPTLQVRLSGTNAIITWPLAATNYSLEYAADLTTTNTWTTITNLPGIMNFQNAITDTIPSSNRFYRLRER